jgi:hypothetical protein
VTNERVCVMDGDGLQGIWPDCATLGSIQASERCVVSGTEGRRSLPDLRKGHLRGARGAKGIYSVVIENGMCRGHRAD